ncbi:hypothetical protein NDU88_003765 [Pleurodeles waltl]|uniref:Uncharacterized protein n=1 Tax=Pleurodeles waltl TaxID=8319 RepID=A0AAV7WW82_PLEWA|nr:hypothetical protein NDU88_003765 [Pleurodeles waltl]
MPLPLDHGASLHCRSQDGAWSRVPQEFDGRPCCRSEGIAAGASEAVLTTLLWEFAIIAAALAGGLGRLGGVLGVGSPDSLSLDPRVRAEAADIPGR